MSTPGPARTAFVPPLCPLAVHAFDFSQTGPLIARAEATSRERLAGGMRHADPRWALLPHHHTVVGTG